MVIGYGATADQAFAKFKEAAIGKHRIFWCVHNEDECPAHVQELIGLQPKSVEVIQGVDFDNFIIGLARELKCFPPVLIESPAEHLLQEIEPIIGLPEEIRGTEDILGNLKAKLEGWKSENKWTTSDKINMAMLKGDWSAAIELEGQARSKTEKNSIAWAYVSQGNELSRLANLKQDETLFWRAFEKYEAALKIKPEMHEALNNWGAALTDLAKLKQNEVLFQQAFEKYEAALKIKPDDHIAQTNWDAALADLAKIETGRSAVSAGI